MEQPNLALYFKMLTHKRPHNTPGEKLFTEKFIDAIPGITADTFGNRMLTIGKNPKTIFSAHLDTVHSKDGLQQIIIDSTTRMVYTDGADCLGADDTSGIYCLMHLIHAKVPGRYIFHRGEERGRLGSKWIADNTPEVLEGIKHAVAFDRRRDCSIITKQCGRTCCSTEFTSALKKRLAKQGIKLAEDPTGSYTDTASYMSTIPECTNISVGYDLEHTSKESQDIEYLMDLVEAITKVHWHDLPAKRDPKAVPTYASTYVGRGWNSYNDAYNDYDDGYLPRRTPPFYNARGPASHTPLAVVPTPAPKPSQTPAPNEEITWNQYFNFILKYPAAAADLLSDYSITRDELAYFAAGYKAQN